MIDVGAIKMKIKIFKISKLMNIIGYLYVKTKVASYVQDLKVYGVPYIKGNSKIEIGKSCILRSNMKSNPLGGGRG